MLRRSLFLRASAAAASSSSSLSQSSLRQQDTSTSAAPMSSSRAVVATSLPTALTNAERFMRGSMRLWSRHVGDRRRRASAPLHDFLEFVARRQQEKRTKNLDLGPAGTYGDEDTGMLSAWRMLASCRTLEVNEALELVQMRHFFEHRGASRDFLRVVASWESNVKHDVQEVKRQHFAALSRAEFINLQTLVDDHVGLNGGELFTVNRFNEDDYTFLLRRALWASPDAGTPVADLETSMRRLMSTKKNTADSDASADVDSSSSSSSSSNRTLPSLPFRCRNALEALNEHLSDYYFLTERDQCAHYFHWDAVVRDAIRRMPPQGLPGHAFRRAVLAAHPALANSRQHGSWKALMERLLHKYDDVVTVSLARTDGVTYIVRRVMPWQVQHHQHQQKSSSIGGGGSSSSTTSSTAAPTSSAAATSVTSETITALALMGSADARIRGGAFVNFDDVARCLSPEATAKVEGAESVWQALQYSKHLQADIRMLVREVRADETVVLLDASAVPDRARIPRMLLGASASAPHARIICARKRHEQPFGTDDCVAPPWMSNSVILVAQLAKLIARVSGPPPADANDDDETGKTAASAADAAPVVNNVIAIVAESEDRDALTSEIKTLVGDHVRVTFV